MNEKTLWRVEYCVVEDNRVCWRHTEPVPSMNEAMNTGEFLLEDGSIFDVMLQQLPTPTWRTADRWDPDTGNWVPA